MKTKAGLKSSACFGVPASLVPKYMKDSSKLWKEKVGDIREFSRVYSVKKAITVEYLDLPVIDETTVLRIYYRASPGLTCKIKIADSQKNVIFESSKLYETGSFSAIIDPEEDANGDKIVEKGHVIFEYAKNETQIKENKSEKVVSCWKNEVIIIMNPYSNLIQNSKCDYVKNSEFSTTLVKKESQMFDVYEFVLDSPISIDERVVLENQKLKLRFKKSINPGDNNILGNLMILVHYDFPFLATNSKLQQVTGTKQKFISYGKVEAYEEELGTDASLTQMANVISYSIPNAFYNTENSFLEAEFSINDNFLKLFDQDVSSSEVCFALSIMVEYVPPRNAIQSEDENDSSSKIKLVKPSILKDIAIVKYHNITLQVDLEDSIIEAFPGIDPASTLSGTLVQQMCALEHEDGSEFDFYEINTDSLFSKTNTIFPIEYSVSVDYKSVFLQFPVSQAYEDTCYKLVCKTDPTVIQGTYYDVRQSSQIQTSY